MLATVLTGALALAGGGGRSVVVRDQEGAVLAEARLPPSGRFALEYRHSYYRAPARESFAADASGFRMVEVASPSEAVLDYYELEGTRERRSGVWTLRPARSARFERMALAATAVGRRTLVAGEQRAPLYDSGDVHLTLEVER